MGEGDLCFDIGANVGERTRLFLKAGARVVAVEPQLICYQQIQRKYGGNTRLTLVHAAVGKDEAVADLMICKETNECSSLSEEFVSTYSAASGFHWHERERVDVITLNKLIREYGVPKLCKIDVEGYESQVLSGLDFPIEVICFEFNRPLLHDTFTCLHKINALGNYECNFISFEMMNLCLDRWLPVSEFQVKLEQIITPEILTGEIIVKLVCPGTARR